MKIISKIILLCAASALAFSSCVAPPALDPQGNVRVSQSSLSLQQKGASEFLKIKKKKKISKNQRYNAQLQRVAKRLTPVINLPKAKWEFVVFEDPTPNAFALPGGKVGVHTGMFKITQSDAGLAAVIGHEIAHVTSDHVGKQQKQRIGLTIGAIVLDQVVRKHGADGKQRAAAATGYGAVAALGFALPYSRNHELEADKVGAIFMARAGYHPREALYMWQRFEKYNQKKGKKTPEFLRTHPLDSTRIQALRNFMPIALKEYKR